MTFQYFFFDTYPGYFLQLLPPALIVGTVCGFWRYRSGRGVGKCVCFGLLGAYLTGLIGLTLLFDLVAAAWYRLIYGMDSGRHVEFFVLTFNLIPDFWLHIRPETIGNMVLFLPFGILHPMAADKQCFTRTLRTGILLVLGIELLQPVFGRAFDVNDIILNLGGVLLSAGGYFIARWYIHK